MFGLKATGISHEFQGHTVLQGVSLSMNDHERVAIVGPSGSGKSTLLSIIGGLLRADSGAVDIQVDDQSATPVRPVISWVLQNGAALGRRTVFDNVRLGVRGLRRDRAAQLDLIETALSSCRIAELRSQRANTLSGGQLQRVSIARALAGQPRLLIADEPTGQLDRSSTHVVIDAMFDAARDCAVLLATHDDVVAGRCHRILEVKDAQLIEHQ